jgi:hypothetical protein
MPVNAIQLHILFLDFDGVLHPNSDRYDNPFCFMDNFCEAFLNADPDGLISIVISSTWRNDETLHELKAHFPDLIASRIVGVTPNLSGTGMPTKGLRQAEINEWLSDNIPSAQWLAIDDRSNYFEDNCPNLFLIPNSDPMYEIDVNIPFSLMDEIERREMMHRKWRIESLGINADVMKLLHQRLLAFIDT